MTKEPWARGGFPDRCVCPRLLYTPAIPLPPPIHLPPLAAPGGSYTNFQECLLPPSVPSNLLLLFTPRSPLRPLLPSSCTSRTSSRVSMATWRRVFAYYTLCVTSRLVRYARVGVGYPPPRASEHVSMCMNVCTCVCVRGCSLRGGCKGISRRCERRQMRNCHLRRRGMTRRGEESPAELVM